MTLDLGAIPKFLPSNKNDIRIMEWLESHPGPLCIACSGGPDSMGLLLWVLYYYPQRPCILLHYDHRIRSVSTTEANQLKILAKQLGVSIEVGYRDEAIGTTEAELRDARYKFFEQMLKLHHASILLLGHHQDDLFETVLMRLVRGVSLEGLIAPKAIHSYKNYTKVRPLLNFTKKDLQLACDHFGIPYFLDETNRSDMCIRNRIRHHVLNQFEYIFKSKNWRQGMARTCSVLAEQRDYLNKHIEQKFSTYDFSKGSCDKSFFKSLHKFECRSFLQKLFQLHGIRNYSFDILDKIIENIYVDSKSCINIDENHRVIFDQKCLYLLKNTEIFNKPFTLSWKHGSFIFPDRSSLTSKTEPFSTELFIDIKNGKFSHKNMAILDADLISSVKIVRNWLPGDRYQPLGFIYEKKVKNLFVENKIHGKDKLRPIVCDVNSDIVWIPGLPPSEKFKVRESTKLCFFLIYKNF